MEHTIFCLKYRHDICKTQCGIKKSLAQNKQQTLCSKNYASQHFQQNYAAQIWNIKYIVRNLYYKIGRKKCRYKLCITKYATQIMQKTMCNKNNMQHKVCSSKYAAHYLQHKMYSPIIKHKICRKKFTEQNMQHYIFTMKFLVQKDKKKSAAQTMQHRLCKTKNAVHHLQYKLCNSTN